MCFSSCDTNTRCERRLAGGRRGCSKQVSERADRRRTQSSSALGEIAQANPSKPKPAPHTVPNATQPMDGWITRGRDPMQKRKISIPSIQTLKRMSPGRRATTDATIHPAFQAKRATASFSFSSSSLSLSAVVAGVLFPYIYLHHPARQPAQHHDPTTTRPSSIGNLTSLQSHSQLVHDIEPLLSPPTSSYSCCSGRLGALVIRTIQQQQWRRTRRRRRWGRGCGATYARSSSWRVKACSPTSASSSSASTSS